MPHSVESIALVVNRLVLAGRTMGNTPISEVELAGSVRLRARVEVECRFPTGKRARGRAAGSSARFLLACQPDLAAAKEIASTPGAFSVRLLSRGRVVSEQTLTVGSFKESGIGADAAAVRMLCTGMLESDAEFAHVLASIAADEPASPTLWWWLETGLAASDCGFVAAGEARGLGGNNVLFLLDECRLAINPAQILIGPAAQPKPGAENTSSTPSHSFTCFDQLGGRRHELRLASVSGPHVQWSNPQIIAEECGPRRLLDRIAHLVPSRELIERPAVADTLRSIAQLSAQRGAEVSVTDVVPGESPPDLSIVVPFYRDDFFLLDHLESQHRTEANAEWIFVCDDPALLPSMKRQCTARRGSIVKPTKLVALSQNVGFAAANNVGFRHSTADHVVFMNSDIHWRSFAPLEFGLKLLRDDPSVGVVGFELHFEDGALQHGGMESEIAPEFGNLVFCVHAGKGLPGKDMGSEISAREVEAVTGALMMVRRSDFAGAAFDEEYFGGDFEDGDLCLSMRALGKKVMLVECSGLFHLERQSIQNFGAPSLFTVLNCMRFTERWRKFEFESR